MDSDSLLTHGSRQDPLHYHGSGKEMAGMVYYCGSLESDET